MRSLLIRKKKFFFIGGLVAFLILAGAFLVNKLQSQDASAYESPTVSLTVGRWTGTTNEFGIDGRSAWCITPNRRTPSPDTYTAVKYTYEELKNGTSSGGYDLTNIRKMFTAYYYTKDTRQLNYNGEGYLIDNVEAMHWGLANLYNGSGRNTGPNAGLVWDNGQKTFPTDLEDGYVLIIPTGQTSAQAIFTADYTKKTSFTQKLEVKKVWRDGISADDHNVSIKFKVKDTTTNSYIIIDDDEVGELNANNNWTFSASFERESTETNHSYSVEEIIDPNDEGFHIYGSSVDGQTYWYHDEIEDEDGNPIYYIMPSDATESCDESDPYHVTCTMYNKSRGLTTVNLWTTKRWNDAGYTGYRPETISYIIHAFVQVDGTWHEVDIPHITGSARTKRNTYHLENTYVWGGVYVAGLAAEAQYPAEGGEMYPVTYAIEEVASSVPSAYGLVCGEDFVYEGNTYCLASQKNDGSGDYEVEWTNYIDKIQVTAKKNWVDGGNSNNRPSFVKFEIYRCTGSCSEKTYYTTAYMTGDASDDSWNTTINLVKTDKDGNEYRYYYKEIDFFNGGTSKFVSEDYIVDGQMIGFAENENTGMVNVAKTNVPVKKCWIDNEDHRPESIKFNVYINGTTRPLDEFSITLTADDEDEDGCWSSVTKDLPAYDEHGNELSYYIKEDTSVATEYNYLTYIEDNEDADVCSINATENFAADNDNKASCVFYNVELVDIPVKKVWAEDKKEDRPGSIDVSLLCGKTILDTVTLSEENNLDGDNTWEYTWENRRIDECEQGYSVAENINIPGYATKITGNAEDGFVITNTKTLDEILTWGGLGAGSFGAIAAGFFFVKRKLFDR